MLYTALYLLLAVLTAQLVLVSYVFEDEAKPAFPDYLTVLKSLGLGLIWPALLVFRVFVRLNDRFDLLGRIDLSLPEKAKWNPAPNLLGVTRRVVAGAVASVAQATADKPVSKPRKKAAE